MPHIHDKIDFCVETFIVYESKVLLRKHDKYNKWLAVGGHIELDEDPNQAALREVKEEVGLDAKLFDGYVVRSGSMNDLIPPRFINRHKINEKHEHIALIYFASASTERLAVPDHEKAECRWFGFDDLDSADYDISLDVKHYAKTALREVTK